MLWLWITQPRFPCKMENILVFRLFSLYYHPNLTVLYFDRNVDLYWCARAPEENCSLSSCSLWLWFWSDFSSACEELTWPITWGFWSTQFIRMEGYACKQLLNSSIHNLLLWQRVKLSLTLWKCYRAVTCFASCSTFHVRNPNGFLII